MGCVPPPIGRLLIAWIFWGLGSGDIKAGYSIVIYEVTAALVRRGIVLRGDRGYCSKSSGDHGVAFPFPPHRAWSTLVAWALEEGQHAESLASQDGDAGCAADDIGEQKRSIKESRDRGSSPHVILRAYSATRREPWTMVNSSSPTSFPTGE